MTETLTPTFSRPLREMLAGPLAANRILVLAPGDPASNAISRELVADDVVVVIAPSADAARTRLDGDHPAAVIVCAELDSSTGYAALQELRSSGAIATDCPAIAYSSDAAPLDRLRALQRGCLDFLAVPIFYPELVARLQLAISRQRPVQTVHTVLGGMQINYAAHSVSVYDAPITVTATEYALLCALAREPAKVWRKAELLRDVWGYGDDSRTRTLDNHACRLRSKLRDAGGDYISNVWGVGYRLLPANEM